MDIFKTHPRGGIAAARRPSTPSTLLYDALEPKAPIGREGSPATCHVHVAGHHELQQALRERPRRGWRPS